MRAVCIVCGNWFTPPAPRLFTDYNSHLCPKCNSDSADEPEVVSGEKEEKDGN